MGRTMHRGGLVLGIALLAVTLGMLTAQVGADAVGARALLRNAHGARVGEARLIQDTDGVLVRVLGQGLPSGFHGFHVHAVGACIPPFASAGGHFNPAGTTHPSHAGDMPVLLVNADGTGELGFRTDRYTLGDLFDADGSALIVHANPDNYANIPTDRYDPDPDASTLATGDAGGRIACGVIEAASQRSERGHIGGGQWPAPDASRGSRSGPASGSSGPGTGTSRAPSPG